MDQFYTVKSSTKDTVEISITIPKENFEKSYELLLKDFTKDTNVKGFRKGNVPTDLIDKGTKQALKLDAFEKLAPLYVSTAINKEKLEPISPPEYKELPKLIDGIDITFEVKITIMPEFKLGNIKKIKIKKEDTKVDDSDVEAAIKELKETQKTQEKEINDKWAIEIGKVIGEDNIKTLDALKEKIKSALKVQKEHALMHQMQDKALAEGIKISNIEVPLNAIEYEAYQREESFNNEMKQRGVKTEDFLKSNNITIEKMRELWMQDAKEALESDTFLNMYSIENKITVEDADLDKRIEEIKKAEPTADPSIFSNPEWREYIRKIDRKEQAFRHFIKSVLGDEFLDEHN